MIITETTSYNTIVGIDFLERYFAVINLNTKLLTISAHNVQVDIPIDTTRNTRPQMTTTRKKDYDEEERQVYTAWTDTNEVDLNRRAHNWRQFAQRNQKKATLKKQPSVAIPEEKKLSSVPMERLPRSNQVVPTYTPAGTSLVEEPEAVSSDSDGYYQVDAYYDEEQDEWNEYDMYTKGKDISLPKRVVEAQQRYFDTLDTIGPYVGYPYSYWVANVLSEDEYWRLRPCEVCSKTKRYPQTYTRRFFKHQAELTRKTESISEEKCHWNFCISSTNEHAQCTIFRDWMKKICEMEQQNPSLHDHSYQEFKDFQNNLESKKPETELQPEHKCTSDCKNPWCYPSRNMRTKAPKHQTMMV
jgi:hypothetical protein